MTVPLLQKKKKSGTNVPVKSNFYRLYYSIDISFFIEPKSAQDNENFH